MDLYIDHARRFKRMLTDLGIDPPSLIADREFAIVDDSQRKRLTPPLGNQTLAEGLISAVKLVAAASGSPGRLGADGAALGEQSGANE